MSFLPTVFPELLVKKSGQNIKKPRRSTSKRFKICSKSRSEIAAIDCYLRGSETVNNINNNSILLQIIQMGKASVQII